MKIELFFAGKTTEAYLQSGIDIYLGRLRHYVAVSQVVFPVQNKKGASRVPDELASRMLAKLEPSDIVVVLDEKGKAMTSEDLAGYLGRHQHGGTRKMVFVTGDAFGVGDALRQRANLILSFSKFTFTHQMIRLLLAEQLYRAMTILRNEKYHHG
jgi:23S rRNA (pseudouridine1915-N3)-methyltransferase